MKYHSAIKKESNTVLLYFLAQWMKLENIGLREEVSQSAKQIYPMFSLIFFS